MNGFFNCFANFRETGDQGILLKASALIFGADDLISVSNTDNHSRHKYRIFLTATGRAVHHTFFCIVFHWEPAASAETAVSVPEPELISGNRSKSKILWLYITKLSVFVEFIAWQQGSIQSRNQIKTFVIYREKIDIIFVQVAYVSFQFAETGKRYRIVCIIFMKETLSVFISEHKTAAIRSNRSVFIVISMWCNILYHKDPPEK